MFAFFKNILVLLALSTAISAQNANLNCQFAVVETLYSCVLIGASVPDNENVNVIIGGTHSPGQSNANVQGILILVSTIPFIVTQLFTTFPNVIALNINAGLTRIQSNAFANAENLEFASISNNNNLRTVAANGFTGAGNLQVLDLNFNQIETVHETAFVGLSSLTHLYLDRNNINELHVNLFRPLTSLLMLILSENRLESLDGRLLENNRLIEHLEINRNQVNAIGRSFLDNFAQLEFFSFVENICANNFWFIGGTTTIDTIRQGLAVCFDNFIEGPDDEVKRFVLQLRGSLTINDENGNEIVTL